MRIISVHALYPTVSPRAPESIPEGVTINIMKETIDLEGHWNLVWSISMSRIHGQFTRVQTESEDLHAACGSHMTSTLAAVYTSTLPYNLVQLVTYVLHAGCMLRRQQQLSFAFDS
jgi:hypothetical protein